MARSAPQFNGNGIRESRETIETELLEAVQRTHARYVAASFEEKSRAREDLMNALEALNGLLLNGKLPGTYSSSGFTDLPII